MTPDANLIDALHGLAGVTITVGEPLPVHSQRLMDTLGVTVVVKDGAPTKPQVDISDGAARERSRRRRAA